MNRLSAELQQELKKNIQNGYVRVSEHPSLPLKIFNYTPKAQYDNEWNEITRMCRGLVLDDDYNIIIKCPPKFFNLGEPFAADIDLLNARISEKLDGYYISIKVDSDYGLIVTSRGSFDNKYVNATKQFLTDDIILQMPTNYTFFCELLQNFPGDEAIILTQHPIPKLVCWAVKDSDFQELPLAEDCPFERAKYMSYAEALQYLQNKVEGVVAQDPKTFERVKIKTEWFLEHHRILADCTQTRVWELVRNGDSVSELDIPDEFMSKMLAWESDFQNQYRQRMSYYTDLYEQTEHLSDKELALSAEISKHDKAYIYSIRKQKQGEKSISALVWQELKPAIIER